MKAALSRLAVALILAALLLPGCVPGLQSAKPTPEGEAVPPPEQVEGGKASAPPGPAAEQPLPPPPPGYNPPPPPDQNKISEGTVNQSVKDEVNEAAKKFINDMPHVKYAKTCFSKEYGPWYLIVYRQGKKNFSVQQYSWNDRSKEWEVTGSPFDVPTKQLEGQFKAEVPGEKCFRLK